MKRKVFYGRMMRIAKFLDEHQQEHPAHQGEPDHRMTVASVMQWARCKPGASIDIMGGCYLPDRYEDIMFRDPGFNAALAVSLGYLTFQFCPDCHCPVAVSKDNMRAWGTCPCCNDVFEDEDIAWSFYGEKPKEMNIFKEWVKTRCE